MRYAYAIACSLLLTCFCLSWCPAADEVDGETVARLSAVQITTAVECRKATLRDITVYLARLYSEYSKEKRPVTFRVEAPAQNASQAYDGATRVSLRLLQPTLWEVLVHVAEEAGVALRVSDGVVVLVSQNVDDGQDAVAWPPPRDPNLLPAVVESVDDTIRVTVTVRHGVSNTDGSTALSGACPLVADVDFRQIRTGYGSPERGTNVIARLQWNADNPIGMSLTSIDDEEGTEGYHIPESQWIIRERTHDQHRQFLGRVSAYDPNLWPRLIPPGRYELHVTCRFEALLESGETIPFAVERTLSIQVVAAVSIADDRECFMAWLHTLFYDHGSTAVERFGRVHQDSIRGLLTAGVQFDVMVNDRRDIGLAALAVGLVDLAYDYLSGYIETYIANPPPSITGVDDIHDPFFESVAAFSRLCHEKGYSDPFAGVDFRIMILNR